MKMKFPKHDSILYVLGMVAVVILSNPLVLIAVGLLIGHFLHFWAILGIMVVMGIGYIL